MNPISLSRLSQSLCSLFVQSPARSGLILQLLLQILPLGMPGGKTGEGNEDLGAKLKKEVDKRALKEVGGRNPRHKCQQGALIPVCLRVSRISGNYSQFTGIIPDFQELFLIFRNNTRIHAQDKWEFRNLIVRDLRRFNRDKVLDPGRSNPKHKQRLDGEWMESPG